MVTLIMGRTAKTNLPRELKLELHGDEVQVSALNPLESAGWMVRIPRDQFVAEMEAFLAGCKPEAAGSGVPAGTPVGPSRSSA